VAVSFDERGRVKAAFHRTYIKGCHSSKIIPNTGFLMKGDKDEKAPLYTILMKRHWGGDSSNMS
jgi:hypothetical protein